MLQNDPSKPRCEICERGQAPYPFHTTADHERVMCAGATRAAICFPDNQLLEFLDTSRRLGWSLRVETGFATETGKEGWRAQLKCGEECVSVVVEDFWGALSALRFRFLRLIGQ